jgi:hypothetical protein
VISFISVTSDSRCLHLSTPGAYHAVFSLKQIREHWGQESMQKAGPIDWWGEYRRAGRAARSIPLRINQARCGEI